MKSNLLFVVACGALVGGLSGCAYLNGDAMWLGVNQKEVRVSNTLLTWFDTEYNLGEDNLPFVFVCLPSEDPYEFGVRLSTNSVFRVRFQRGNEAREGDDFVEVRNGIMRVVKNDRPEEVYTCKAMNIHVSPSRGSWRIWAWSEGNETHYVEGEYPLSKMRETRRLVVEECKNTEFRHQSNWYEW